MHSGTLRPPADGAAIIANISRTLALDFAELEEALQESFSLAGELYSPVFNTDCCAGVCIRGEDYNITRCNELCDLSSNISRFAVYRTQAGMGNGTGFIGTGTDMELEPELYVNNSAIHIPLDIYENGEKERERFPHHYETNLIHFLL